MHCTWRKPVVGGACCDSSGNESAVNTTAPASTRKPFIGSSGETWDLPAVPNRQPEMFSREVAHNITTWLSRRIQKSIKTGPSDSSRPEPAIQAFITTPAPLPASSSPPDKTQCARQDRRPARLPLESRLHDRSEEHTSELQS